MEQRRSMNDIIVHKKDDHPLLQSVRPKRSIREITREEGGEFRRDEVAGVFGYQQIEERRKEERRQAENQIPAAIPEEKAYEKEVEEDVFAEEVAERHSRRPFGMWVLAFLSSLVLVFAASTYFYGAKITVTPTQNAAPVSEKLIAGKGSPPGGVQFSMVTLSDEKEAVVKASGEETVNKKASGIITILNSYSDKPQRLINNTRFMSPDGKVYRISASVVVPGVHVSGGKQVPGEVDATIYADTTGAEYNSESVGAVFTVPGFKGDPRYEKIFGQSKTEITGGFNGKMKVVSDADRTAALDKLKTDLRETLVAAARAQAPSGYMLSDNAAQIVFTEVEKEGQDLKSDEALVTLSGKLTGALISVSDLTKILAEKYLVSAGYNSAKHSGLIVLDRPEALTLTPDLGVVFAQDTNEFKFTISGDTHFVWKVDEAALARDIAGTPLKNFNEFITQAYPSVGRAEASRRPFWAFWIGNFPDSSARIKVVVEEPKIEE